VLLVEHDRDFVEQVAERVSVLAVGRIVAAGGFAEVRSAWSAA
jgi:ABC-type uncharacterized transport system ATPase subunit